MIWPGHLAATLVSKPDRPLSVVAAKSHRQYIRDVHPQCLVDRDILGQVQNLGIPVSFFKRDVISCLIKEVKMIQVQNRRVLYRETRNIRDVHRRYISHLPRSKSSSKSENFNFLLQARCDFMLD